MVMVFACADKATVLHLSANLGGTIRRTAEHFEHPWIRQREVATKELTERLEEHLRSVRNPAL
ncbi:hypothetical protein APY03_2399 [Variovorax sp. WDL1]|nr:hypothetical protein APY03_2399 [Variovorax sp. WDL1]